MLLVSFAFVVGTVVLLLAAGVGYQQYGLRRDRRKYTPAGRFVSLSGRRFHIDEAGSGQPTVVFESGLASSSLSWTPVQRVVAQTTCAISYDRAGIGWSDDVNDPRTMSSIVGGLGALLSASGHRPPYVLVGHSFGGLLVRAYASLRKQELAALILIDPVSLDLWADCSPQNERRLRLGAKLCRRGVLLANVGIVRLALTALASGRTRLPKMIANASAGKAVGTLGKLVGVVQKLPASLRPSVQSHWSNAKSFRALAEYLEILRPCACEARNLPLPPDIPLTILSAGDATDQELSERQLWVDRSIRGRHIKVSDSGHWLQLERPEQVAAAIVELIEFVRQPTNQ